jgi:hypothetical protein
VIKRASEIVEGDVILGRAAGPLTARADAALTPYRGGPETGYRIKVRQGPTQIYPAIVTRGDPEMYVADNPDDAWNEHVKIREKL